MIRVVSLVPSITETVMAWGVKPVGVTRFCEVPGITMVGGTKNPDLRAIAALAPDVVLMDREENRAEDAEALRSAGLKVHATQVRSAVGVAGALSEIAVALELEPPGGDELPSFSVDHRVKAWIPIWRRPWMSISAATYGSSLLELAGVDNVFAGESDPYPRTTTEEAARRGPEVVLAPSEPYPFSERHRAELESVAPALFVDGRDLFWWGIRTPSAAVRIAALAAGVVGR